jgi:uncharacterized protein
MPETAINIDSAIDEALLQEIARKITVAFNPRRIILFGSRARGDARGDSDVDLFVEMESQDKPLDRYCKVRAVLRDLWIPLDLIVMTPEEVIERRNSLVSLVPIIEREGKLLYQR